MVELNETYMGPTGSVRTVRRERGTDGGDRVLQAWRLGAELQRRHFSAVKGGTLVAYRWDGEQEIDPGHFHPAGPDPVCPTPSA